MVTAATMTNVRTVPPTPDAVLDRAVRDLCRFVGIPSVSAHGQQLEAGAEHTAALLSEAGLDVEVWQSDGAPIVFAERAAPPGVPTVLFYGHYDVQPAEPLEQWQSPPFEATIRDGAVYGRGAGDNKGQLLAHVVAVRELLSTGDLGVGVKFLVEGEEEIGSPHIAAVAERHRNRLVADLALTSDAPLQANGQPVVIFGVRGLLYLEVTLEGARTDLHSGNRGGVAPTPAWRLIHLLSRLRDTEGTVRVPGFCDQVRPPTKTERELLRQLEPDAAALAAELGAQPAVPPGELAEALMFRPTFNLAGLWSGYSGVGIKTVVPHRAGCKIDIRLVADQNPDDVFAAVCAAVARLEPEARVRCLAAVPPSATPMDTPLAPTLIDSVAAAYGREPVLCPRLSGTTPDYVFTRVLGLPSLLVPYGPPDMNHHAPDERMTIEALDRGIRCTSTICRALGGRGESVLDDQGAGRLATQ